MPQITEGTVTIVIPDSIEIPDKSGMLKPDEVKRIPKARKGIGLACAAGAVEMNKKGEEFKVPGVDPTELDKVGAMAEDIDIVIEDLDVVLNKLKQANLLLDAKAFDLLGRLNDQIQAQGKRDPSLLVRFKTVLDYFRRRRTDGSSNPKQEASDTPPVK